jgi:hypothetical protein
MIFSGNEIHNVQSLLFIYNPTDYMMAQNAEICGVERKISRESKGLELNSKGNKENIWQS